MQSRSAAFCLQLLQAWKAQPVFVSIVGGNSSADAAAAIARSFSSVARQAASSQPRPSFFFIRSLSNSAASSNAASGAGNGGGAAPKPGADSSFWGSLRKSLFPVGSSPKSPGGTSFSPSSHLPGPAAGPAGPPRRPTVGQATSPSSPAAAAVVASREARAAARRTARVQEDAFKALSAKAEAFSGTLLKAAVLLITIPLAVHMLSNSLMTSLCIKGLEADRPETVALTMRRIRSVVVSEYLATKFDESDGVGGLMATFTPGAPEVVLREFIATAQQLLQYQSTRDALLMSSLVERLEKAEASGWLPEALREPARQLYLDAHSSLRMEMESGAVPRGPAP